MSYTITYDESVRGFTSFHSFLPDWMAKLNNRFFSIKDGQLYLHNNEDSELRNNFYGVQYPTKLTYIINDAPSDIKVVKTLNTESNKSFDAVIRSYLNDETESITETTLSASEFLNKEGKWYAYARRNEIEEDYSAKNVYGLGFVSSVSTSTITLSYDVPLGSIAIGDSLLDSQGNNLGTIESYLGADITLNAPPVVAIGEFVIGYKSPRVEGSEIRGYNFEVELTDNSTDRTEIYAASSEVFKSYPS